MAQNLSLSLPEHQLTYQPYGHTLHHTQCFSPDDQWLVFDTRNDDTQILSTGSIRVVNVQTGEVRELYQVPNQTDYGPGVGAATFSPKSNQVIFIHGIRNASQNQPYSFTRRTGVSVWVDKPQEPIFMDARHILPPFTPGALRGGTHAHSWSGDGAWISFTYNDYILEQLSKTDPSKQDLRTVGVMMPGKKVLVPDDETLENHSGEMFSVVVTQVQENPTPGSDEIDKAFDETWIGRHGYQKPDGTRQQRAIAFQGSVRDESGELKTEIFVVDLPADITQANPGKPLEGTLTTRPNVPAGVSQRRITFTKKGVREPRHWLRTTPDGCNIGFLAPDVKGLTQIFRVSPIGGKIKQVTFNSFPVQGQFNFSPKQPLVAYAADNSIYITHLESGTSTRLTEPRPEAEKPIGAPVWSNNGKLLAYNRYVGDGAERFLQIFLLDLPGLSGI
ncbi:biopolymer transporter Tol [Adhaeribacter aerolatus]|uniref:Biopolymer transporter Tol n=1 Tax=Adhaeribacter aerolatus TaxID=670289 RepID=A0A512AY33_9BACT|nr:DUF3748 domain-containing protein [Adhaeribacter aerolatus]GEO04427.1 biopolymer transporter Tol [Adhaeribacter aerolatus]